MTWEPTRRSRRPARPRSGVTAPPGATPPAPVFPVTGSPGGSGASGDIAQVVSVFRAAAFAEVVLYCPASASDSDGPDGAAQIAWTDEGGSPHIADIRNWKRLDRLTLPDGGVVDVQVQARAAHDLRLPAQSAQMSVTVTESVDDIEMLVVGDLRRRDGWRYGLRMVGVRKVQP